MYISTETAVRALTRNIKKDSDLYGGYKANIAMAFKDEFDRNPKKYKNKNDVDIIANIAAQNFLDSWINN